jgi:APA family basic amino acid/polyamine antiporter
MPPIDHRGGDELARKLGTWDTTLLTIGSVIGTGIFLTSSDIARVLPSAGGLLAVWLAGGLLTVAGALTYAELGVLFPRAGGIYHYLKEAYGPLWGFLYGWGCFLVIMSGGIAALAVAFGEYLGVFVPFASTSNVVLSAPVGPWVWSVSGAQLAAAAAILALTAVNHFGVREGATVQNLLTVLKVGSIVGIVAFGLTVKAPAHSLMTTAAAPASGLLAAFGVAMIAALWTYDGWYGPTFSAGEMRRPERNLPFGLIGGALIITLLYVALNLVYLRAFPIAEMGSTQRIGEAAATVLFGARGGQLVALAILLSTFGCLSATILYSSRIYLPMARDGLFFRSLGRVHPEHRTPTASLWAQSLWAVLLTLSGSYEQLYTFTVFAAVLFHIGTGAAIFVFRRTLPDHPRPYRVWGYPWVPAAFILASVLLVANTLFERPVESLLGVGLLALGLPAYATWRRRAAAETSR